MKNRIISAALCLVMLALLFVPVDAYSDNETMKVFHIDCGRKYFSLKEICEIINNMSLNGFTHLQLAFGNNGLRFVPDELSVSAGDRSYTADEMKSAIAAGNEAYTRVSTGCLSEREMDYIIDFARKRGVEIIPLLNMPGHMNALLLAMETVSGEDYSYKGSASTLDVMNEDAVDFAITVLDRYIEYFDSRGCCYFNIGADEYANDIFRSDSMGFGQLISDGDYGSFADYVNLAASRVKNAGMIPMAFNDGIYFADTKSCGGREVEFDTDILICYWQKGWGGYTTRKAVDLVSDGFDILNTNNNWYYVLGREEGMFGYASALKAVKEIGWDNVMGDYFGAVDTVGSMLCLWCDYPSEEYSRDELANLSRLMKFFAISNPELEMLPELRRNEKAEGERREPHRIIAERM